MHKYNFEIHQEMKLIYQTWINLWCASFDYQEEVERKFRIKQLLQVLKKMRQAIIYGQ